MGFGIRKQCIAVAVATFAVLSTGPAWHAQEVTVQERGFLYAPDGNWSNAHSDTIINYLDWYGNKWTARLQGNGFLHAPNGDWSKAHPDTILNYLTWGGGKWTARLQGNRFLHAPDGDWSKAHPDIIINYLDWNGNK